MIYCVFYTIFYRFEACCILVVYTSYNATLMRHEKLEIFLSKTII